MDGPPTPYSGLAGGIYQGVSYVSARHEPEPRCGPRRGPRRARSPPGGPPEVCRSPSGRLPEVVFFKYMRRNAKNARLTRSLHLLVDVAPVGLEYYAIWKESSTELQPINVKKRNEQTCRLYFGEKKKCFSPVFRLRRNRPPPKKTPHCSFRLLRKMCGTQ